MGANYYKGLVINEYRNGKLINLWDSLYECARYHKTHAAVIKELIYFGNPLPNSQASITFDFEYNSPYDIRALQTSSLRRQFSLIKNK